MARNDGVLDEYINIDADGICKIIETCANNGVESLIYGKLNVVFESKPIESVKLPIGSPPLERIVPSDDIAQDVATVEANESIEQSLAEQRLEELYITDPLAAETMLANGELENA